MAPYGENVDVIQKSDPLNRCQAFWCILKVLLKRNFRPLFSAKFTLHYCDGEKIQSSERSIDRWIDRVNIE